MTDLKVTSPLGVKFLEIQLGTNSWSCSICSSTSPARKQVQVKAKFQIKLTKSYILLSVISGLLIIILCTSSSLLIEAQLTDLKML